MVHGLVPPGITYSPAVEKAMEATTRIYIIIIVS